MPAYQTALRSLFLVAMHHGVQLRPEDLAKGDPKDPLGTVLRIMYDAGLKGKVLRVGWDDLGALGSAYPVMAIAKDGRWLIVLQVVAGEHGNIGAMVLDPTQEASGVMLTSREQFVSTWSGELILCRRVQRLTDEGQPFGLRWFIPEIMRQKRSLRDVAVAATMCNLLAFATPLLYNVVIDKVVPHRSYHTLYIILLVFAVAILFDCIFNYIRQYLMVFASNKIDARLASRTYQTLLGLPQDFFESTPVGVLARHMQQTEKIRHFLTGRLFQTLLDAAMLPVLIVILMFYSWKLTLVVLCFSAAIAAVIGVMIPTFRFHLNKLYEAEGARQAHLIETLHGMRTIKTLCLEPVKKNSWDAKVITAVKRYATVGRVGTIANVLTSGLDKSMQIGILGFGAIFVFDGTISIGALVAFNMLSGRVSGPLVQIVALINEYQETALSIRMLSTIMDHPPERSANTSGIRPVITGDMVFDRVTFRYPRSSTPALDRVSFKIEEGKFIGVVGRSGSGKTTMTRMIHGIQTAQEGQILLNGIDIRNIELPHLRRSIGVVLQENFLFRGTIRENIATTRPDAPLDEIIQAAHMAGAAEFVEKLALSYDTMLEEGASNLSGGQRQRLAIARALMFRPRLLIFDEATSALDPESEAIVQKNLALIAHGRTMIVVSHRLSSLVQADAILVLENGRVDDFAPHATLVERCEVYSRLWQQQTQHMRCEA
jgi:ATP-binding cassette, subfamily B, bacterial HlyB/CyaB